MTEAEMARALAWADYMAGNEPAGLLHLQVIKEAFAAYDPDRIGAHTVNRSEPRITLQARYPDPIEWTEWKPVTADQFMGIIESIGFSLGTVQVRVLSSNDPIEPDGAPSRALSTSGKAH